MRYCCARSLAHCKRWCKGCAQVGPEQTHNGTRAFQGSTALVWRSHAVLDVTVFWMVVDEKEVELQVEVEFGSFFQQLRAQHTFLLSTDRIRPRNFVCVRPRCETFTNAKNLLSNHTCLPRILRECAQQRREWNSRVTKRQATLVVPEQRVAPSSVAANARLR